MRIPPSAPIVNPRHLWKGLAKVVVSFLCGGGFYSAWLAAFLLVGRFEGSVLEAVFWLLAPVVTAVGHAVGVTLFERLAGEAGEGFLRILVWPLIGCAVGAGAVYWFGPMLIVFGMLAAGTVGVALREAIRLAKGRRV